MSLPRLGMYYEDVRKRVKRISHTTSGDQELASRLVVSLLNQSKLCDGEGAKRELEKELAFTGRSFSGAGNKQIGFGEGKRFGTGNWQFNQTKKKWERID